MFRRTRLKNFNVLTVLEQLFNVKQDWVPGPSKACFYFPGLCASEEVWTTDLSYSQTPIYCSVAHRT